MGNKIKGRIVAYVLALSVCISVLIPEITCQAATVVKTGNITCQIMGNRNIETFTKINGSHSGWIYPSDLCVIKEMYDSGWVRVEYPTTKGKKTAYAKSNAFFTNVNFSKNTYTTASNTTVYYKSDLKSKLGTTTTGDKVYLLGYSNGNQQILYPLSSGGYKLGFVKGTLKVKNTTNNIGKINMSYGLYKNNSGRLTCGFNGYKNTKGYHEGIDFACWTGAKVYSLTDGIITRVSYGKRGSGGLSTIAIYNSTYNKTIVYLHTAPKSGLYVGKKISKGEQIATEDWRGVSSASASHTHVEVREGKKTGAAKSVGDYVLENKNPTAFWQSLNYNVR